MNVLGRCSRDDNMKNGFGLFRTMKIPFLNDEDAYHSFLKLHNRIEFSIAFKEEDVDRVF